MRRQRMSGGRGRRDGGRPFDRIPGEFAEQRGAYGPSFPPGGGPFGGPFRGGFGGGFGGHGGRGRGRHGGRARRGDVRASLLALLKERPMHGYEMITEIGERTSGAWRPSPGSVYPTLQLLEEEGLIEAQETGGKRLFTLTETGRTEAEAGAAEPWQEAGRGIDWEAVHEVGQALASVEQAIRQVMATGTEEQRTKGLAVLVEARKKLYLILAEEG
ncbi:DNA-binding PadR family transcriptional regulator [Kitasatospora sp. GAS204A]|uniref:PadR family transcriptional regulator n=1 Tax=unclassified Kitasatospora TaxID=2633591 RepID=UPI002474498F|nr:PadR family transcriptional regulator [Kitasatospora sp. GAS204B]MDH6115774.1 DNA-binding PadR family transcriptional regulator [Kitasatospora sp. GAS204B]